MVEDLKAIEPRRDRAWRPDLEGWWIAAEHEEIVVDVVRAHLGAVLVISEDGGSDELVDADGSRARQERLDL